MADIQQDMLMNLVFNVARFAEGAQTVINGLDRMEEKTHRLSKSFAVVSTALGVFLGHLASDAFRAGIRGFGKLVGAIGKAEDVADRIGNLRDIILQGLGGPLWDTVASIASDVLGRITSAFRDSEGRWTSGFLRLRAVVQTFAGWLLSLWQRLMGSLEGVGRNWLDSLVDGIAKAVTKAAQLLRRFATFLAGILGGRAPGAVTEAAVARTRPEAGWEPTAVYLPPTAEEPEKAAAKPPKAPKVVAPPSAEDINKLVAIQSRLTQLTTKLAEASERAAAARAAMARAEDALEKASEKVYDIRRKLQALELAWAEIPERFVRGRRRQIQMELAQAEHQEHERKKEADGARDRLQAAEAYQNEIERTTDALKRQGEQLAADIERQRERYAAYQQDLQQYAADLAEFNEKQAAAAQKTVDQFAGLDELTAQYTEEIEGQLLPAFASIEESLKSIGSSLVEAFKDGLRKGLEFRAQLMEIRDWLIQVIEKIRQLFEEVAEKAAKAWEKIKPFVTGGTGAPMLAGEEESIYERLVNWLQGRQNKAEVEETAEESFFEPVVGVFNRLYDAIAGRSIVPDMMRDILSAFQQLADDVVGPLTQFTDFSIDDFHRLTESWLLDIGNLSSGLERLTGRFEVLGKALKGLDPMPEALKLAANGSFKVVTVTMHNPQFGAGVNEWEIRDWMYDALADVVR